MQSVKPDRELISETRSVLQASVVCSQRRYVPESHCPSPTKHTNNTLIGYGASRQKVIQFIQVTFM